MSKYLCLAAALMMAGGVALAQSGTPSSKATAAINTAVYCTMSSTSDGAGVQPPTACTDLYTGATVEPTPSGFIPIMDATIKVSNSQSLFVTPSLVTGLYTNTAVKTKTGSSGSTSTAVAMGGVYMRAVLLDSNGNVVATAYPIADCATLTTAPFGCVQSSGDWGVILDSRIQTLSQTLSDCVVSITGGGSGTCTFDLTTQLILQTASAHTFGLIFPNVGVGTYTVEIQAAVDSSATVTSGGGGSGTAVGSAAFGLGSLTVQSVRLVNSFSF